MIDRLAKAARGTLAIAGLSACAGIREHRGYVMDQQRVAAIQPGGALRDEEVIKAADERGMTMVFTGIRHFRH